MKWTTTLLVAVALLVAAPAAPAQMGLGVMWTASSEYNNNSFSPSSGMVPIFAFPIMIGGSLLLQPMLGGASAVFEGATESASQFRVGGIMEYHFGGDGAVPLLGAKGLLEFNSKSVGDGWTNIHFGVFLGATADVAENVSIIGQWGPTYRFIGKEGRGFGGPELVSSTEASLTLRWWIFD